MNLKYDNREEPYLPGEDEDARHKRLARQEFRLRAQLWFMGVASLVAIGYIIANW